MTTRDENLSSPSIKSNGATLIKSWKCMGLLCLLISAQVVLYLYSVSFGRSYLEGLIRVAGDKAAFEVDDFHLPIDSTKASQATRTSAAPTRSTWSHEPSGTSTKAVSSSAISTSLSPPDPRCGYFARSFWDGRLGSQMFVYASFYGMAKAREREAGKAAFIRVSNNPSSLDDIYENLSIPQRVLPDSWFDQRNFSWIGERHGCCTCDNVGLEVACDGKNVIVGGYRQSFKYFVKFSDEIKREFTFKFSIREKCQQLFNDSLAQRNLSDANCVTVGVHLRRGDFARKEKMEFGHWPAQEDYLRKAVRFYEIELLGRRRPGDADDRSSGNNSAPCLAFLIFGNDLEWNTNASQTVSLLHENRTHLILVNPDKFEPAVAMCVMRLCDHMAITTGTFSWWSGFFSRGMVTRQSQYARVRSSHYNEYKVEDFYPPHWIAL